MEDKLGMPSQNPKTSPTERLNSPKVVPKKTASSNYNIDDYFLGIRVATRSLKFKNKNRGN